jgi:hypothetical protein
VNLKTRVSAGLWKLLDAADGGERLMPLEWDGFVKKRKAAYDKAAFAKCAHPEAAEAGYLLYQGRVEESHAIAQDLGSAEGGYWHGILHRMEPDDWNANYWFQQVGEHAIGAELAAMAGGLGYTGLKNGNWDAKKFVEFCSSAREGSGVDQEDLARRVQLLEWQLLMAHCGREK